MRTVHWLFVVSIALFVSGIGLVVAAGRATRSEAPVEVTVTTPVATIKQIMKGITGPAAAVVYSSVSTIVSAEGVKEIAPKDDEEWAAVATGAAALVESGNLLMIGNRAVDRGDWVTITQALIDSGKIALKAAEAQDREGMLEAGGAINVTCDNCHAKYQRQ